MSLDPLGRRDPQAAVIRCWICSCCQRWSSLQDNGRGVYSCGCIATRNATQCLSGVLQKLTDVLTKLLASDRDVVHRVGVPLERQIRHLLGDAEISLLIR